jgi:signal transduction histidine kinase
MDQDQQRPKAASGTEIPQKILLVDDREDNLLSMETILETEGYQFVKANSGRQALKILLTEFDFALILMDVKMPNLNGFETATLIYEREKLKHIPIIFITANNYGEENIFKGYRAGAVDYIYKPINPELLRAKVSVFVDLYKKNYQLLLQEQKLKSINVSLQNEIKEREASEDKVRQLNLQLMKNISRLETANRELDRFAFMASHDLQEPLRKIRTFSDRLMSKNKNLGEEDLLYIDRIQRAAGRMQALIEDILTFSKISGEQESFVNSDLNVILGEVLSDLETSVDEKNAKILIDRLPSLNVNPGLIRPLFHNLISNALKYCKKDVSPIIRIHSEINTIRNGIAARESESRYCKIFVEDNGIGFDQKYSEHIFGMFKRLHSNSEVEGTGIGLALCKKIVEKHNGAISARSKVNEGSTFIITLPMQNGTSAAALA